MSLSRGLVLAQLQPQFLLCRGWWGPQQPTQGMEHEAHSLWLSCLEGTTDPRWAYGVHKPVPTAASRGKGGQGAALPAGKPALGEEVGAEIQQWL